MLLCSNESFKLTWSLKETGGSFQNEINKKFHLSLKVFCSFVHSNTACGLSDEKTLKKGNSFDNALVFQSLN